GQPDPKGSSVSGLVRLADLMTRAGFTAFDGGDCTFDPFMSGVKADTTLVYPIQVDADGAAGCSERGMKYTTKAFVVPPQLPDNPVVIAMNGGSDYLYVPSHDAELVKKVVRFLQSREEYGAVFVSARYGDVPGTIPLETIRAANTAGRNPDIIVSF